MGMGGTVPTTDPARARPRPALILPVGDGYARRLATAGLRARGATT